MKPEGSGSAALSAARQAAAGAPAVASMPRVIVVVLNWNRIGDTLECVQSLQRCDYANRELVVVDNGSSDGSLEILAERFPDVTRIQNGANLGFAEGNNRGLEYALQSGADFILLLNNDTVVDPACLSALEASSRRGPARRVLGTQTLYYHERETVWSLGMRWKRGRFEHVARKESALHWQRDEELDCLIGCAMWIPRRALEEVGLFEPRFFLMWEEIDWCSRAARLGWRFQAIAGARVWHKVSASFQGDDQRTYYMSRNRLLWIERNLRGWPRWSLYLRRDLPQALKIALRLSGWGIAWGVCSLARVPVRSTCQKRFRSYRAAASGLWDYARRRFGPGPARLASGKGSP